METLESNQPDVAVLEPIELRDEPARKRTPRHTAFKLAGKENKLDTVQIRTEHGLETITIPALFRTSYWAGLKYMYLHAEQKVYCEDICNGIEELMKDADRSKWERFIGRSMVKTCLGANRQVVEQAAETWQSRFVTNFRNLCRLGGGNGYGRRLLEMGHVLRYETELSGRGYFYLHLKLTEENVKPLKRGRKSRTGR